MSRKKYANQKPQILNDLNTLFQSMYIAEKLNYQDFESLTENLIAFLPEQYKHSIYVKSTAMNKITKLETGLLIRANLFYEWSKSKEIFEFDTDFADELMKTEIKEIPYEALSHLPYKTFAITLGDNYIIIHHCYDRNYIISDYLFLAYVSGKNRQIDCLGIPMNEQFSTIDDLAKICKDSEHMKRTIKFLNLAIYLTAQKADIQPNPEQKTITKRSPHKTTNTYKEIRKWNVGVRIGTVFRNQKHQTSSDAHAVTHNNKNHASPRPHIRKAHWHSFWTGSKSDPSNRVLTMKWLPPIPVNTDDFDDKPIVIHKTVNPDDKKENKNHE